MDEPLSNLDAKLRVQMRAEIARLQHELGVTTIYVTHDQVEAMTMGDRVAVMRKGELQQVAPPQELYDRPVNLFVGGFIGRPAMNMLEVDDRAAERRGCSRGPRRRVARARRAESVAARPALARLRGQPVIARHPPRGPRGRVTRSRRHRRPPAARASWGSVRRSARRSSRISTSRASRADRGRPRARRDVGQEARRRLRTEEPKTTIVGRFKPRSRASKTGDRVESAVDTSGVHFFDMESGLGIYA